MDDSNVNSEFEAGKKFIDQLAKNKQKQEEDVAIKTRRMLAIISELADGDVLKKENFATQLNVAEATDALLGLLGITSEITASNLKSKDKVEYVSHLNTLCQYTRDSGVILMRLSRMMEKMEIKHNDIEQGENNSVVRIKHFGENITEAIKVVRDYFWMRKK